MKKLILVASIALAFASCNTEEPLDSQETAIVAKAPSNEKGVLGELGYYYVQEGPYRKSYDLMVCSVDYSTSNLDYIYFVDDASRFTLNLNTLKTVFKPVLTTKEDFSTGNFLECSYGYESSGKSSVTMFQIKNGARTIPSSSTASYRPASSISGFNIPYRARNYVFTTYLSSKTPSSDYVYFKSRAASSFDIAVVEGLYKDDGRYPAFKDFLTVRDVRGDGPIADMSVAKQVHAVLAKFTANNPKTWKWYYFVKRPIEVK